MGVGGRIKRGWQALSGVTKVVTTIIALLGAPAAVISLGDDWGKVRDWFEDRGEGQSEFDRTPNVGLEFWQDGTLAPMLFQDGNDDLIRVELDPGPFTMRVPSVEEEMAVEVCAWTDESVIRHKPNDPDIPANKIPCMRPGRGIADEEYASGRLYLNKEAKNYLIGTRLRKHSAELDQAFFSRTWLGDRQSPLSQQEDPLYLAVYIDRNANRIIEFGEYEAVELKF